MSHNYRIRIGVTTDGRPLVGAPAVRAAALAGELEMFDLVYASQLKHRVVAYVRQQGTRRWRWAIVTPTQLQRFRELMLCKAWEAFPERDRSRSLWVKP